MLVFLGAVYTAGSLVGPMYQQAWWIELKDILAVVTVIVGLVTFWSNTSARRLDNTMKVIDFYNRQVRLSMSRTMAETNKQLTVTRNCKKAYSKAKWGVIAQLADVPEAVPFLDELGLYLGHSANKKMILSVITSEVLAYLEDDAMKVIVPSLVIDSKLLGIRKLYAELELRGLE